ncbi:hypothetical protein B0H17DRAFT_59310 [Mycena rosella]|uniref:Uncharacterized protein n=1 Tax=Mycena rosella TaxID=1033263 RepID=A0AAD7D782_MYCRO|nr:hypothetical protein B0H17DRAFT_59310 [Mycena rosella]
MRTSHYFVLSSSSPTYTCTFGLPLPFPTLLHSVFSVPSMSVDAFPACGLGVSVATDRRCIKPRLTQPRTRPPRWLPCSISTPLLKRTGSSTHGHCSPTPASSHGHGSVSSQSYGSHGKAHGKPETRAWGAVLLFLGIPLGLDGVNPRARCTMRRSRATGYSTSTRATQDPRRLCGHSFPQLPPRPPIPHPPHTTRRTTGRTRTIPAARSVPRIDEP